MDYCDASSDEGDQLNTPIADSAQLVEVAYPPGLSDTFPSNVMTQRFDECATAVSVSQGSSNDESSSSASAKATDSPSFKDFFPASPSSVVSSPSVASSALDPSMLCSTTLLDTQLSLDDSSLDLYPSSIEKSLSPLSSPPNLCSMNPCPSRPTEDVDESSSPHQISPLRKRASDTQSPPGSTRAGQKPKLTRTIGPEFLPSTLGRSYSSRFALDHRLRSDFVRTYALDAELGSGGYGFVMTARHRHEGHEVAVKFIPKDKMPRYGWITDEHGEKVPKEAWFLSKVDHPAIVKFHDLYEDDVYFYLVMELHGTPWHKRRNRVVLTPCPQGVGPETDENVPPGNASSVATREGGAKPSKLPRLARGPLARPAYNRRASHDLFECIEQSKLKRFSEEDAKYVFAQVVDVVDYLDQIGITHCDIKDENVVIDKDLKIKLIDFGSVVSIDPTEDRPFYKTFYGTAAYASPEIIQNQPYQAPPAEIWAMGVLLSFLITGSSPFPTEEDKRSARIVITEENRKRMSDDCFHLLQMCLEIDPEMRADIAEVKAHPWLAGGLERLLTERSEE